MNNIAPIVLFCYRRLDSLKLTVANLQANPLAGESDLFIYSDGWHDIMSQHDIEQVRKYIKGIKGFKSLSIVESPINRGLANSVIQGVSEVVNKFGSCIVMEDDLLTSPNFLYFMNQSLHAFEKVHRVNSISGYSFDFKPRNDEYDAYFLNRSWSWGWATWADRWNAVDWEMKIYESFKLNTKEKGKFAQLGSDVNIMLKRQMNGKIDSWGIRFTFNQFLKNGVTLYPKISKVNNIGFDQYATHTVGLKDRFVTETDASAQILFEFPEVIETDQFYQKQFMLKFNVNNRILNKIKEFFAKIRLLMMLV